MLLIVSVLLHIASVMLHIVSVRLVAHCKCFVAHCEFLLHIVSACFGLLHFSEIPSKTRELPEPLPGKKQQKANEEKRGSFHFFFTMIIFALLKEC